MNYGDLFKSDSAGLDLLSASSEIPLNTFSYMTITEQLVGKPWVIAELQYSNFKLWWAIAKANKVRVPMIMRDTFRIRSGKPNVDNIITDFYLGRVIIIPSIQDINEYISTLNGVK